MTRGRAAFQLDGASVRAGQRREVELPISRLVSGSIVSLPVMVVHGRGEGPTIWVSAAVHGDEINGVAIIRKVLARLDARRLRGTLLAVPIVNVHGFITGDRYLPDRRDLNRSFPGSARGSMASRLANLLMTKVVARCSVGIDLHTGTDHRANWPQVRANLADEATLDLATAFGAPLMLHSETRDGSLRHAATVAGATVLLYEAGEPWRFDRHAIDIGVDGVLRVFGALDMIDDPPSNGSPRHEPLVAHTSRWIRAGTSGILELEVDLGDQVDVHDVLGNVYDSFGRKLAVVRAALAGVVIGMTRNPLINRGDALVHIAPISARATDPEL